MTSTTSTLVSIIFNKFMLAMVVLAFLVNTGLSITEKWAKGVLPASAQELLDLQVCAESSDPHLKNVVLVSLAKPLSKHQATELLEKCSK